MGMKGGLFAALGTKLQAAADVQKKDSLMMNLGDKIGVQQNCQSGGLLVMDTFSG